MKYDGGDKIEKKDYQPGEKEFAGKMSGKANEYMERKNKEMSKAASKIKGQAWKGRYD